ncbi:MAG: ATP-binding protein [Treponema sp.]|nr:ATP-binding protein [Treponema sp.]
MRYGIQTIIKISVLLLAVSIFSFGCSNARKPGSAGSFSAVLSGAERLPLSFYDVPGITSEEIAAIEAIQKQERSFIYGMPLSTETFLNGNGEIKGFSALFCEWLSGFFGIPFIPELFDWLDLLAGLESHVISFSGEITATEERLRTYHMTSAIASRPLKYYRLNGSRPLDEIVNERPLKCGFIEGTSTIHTVISELETGSYEVITLSDVSLVYEALKSGKIDAFYYSGTVEANFIQYSDMYTMYFFPLIYRPVSLTTQNPVLFPFITVMEKVLESGGIRFLTAMYNQGHQQYMHNKLNMQLTEEEHEYIKNNPVIPIGVDPGNYPGSFFDKRYKQWRGVSLDILDEITSLTGLTFKRVNNENTGWPEILEMLRSGDITLVPELTQSASRLNQFLWPETGQITDHFALISHADYPDIKVNEILYVKVGLARDTVYADTFRKWFPNHMNTVEYESTEEALEALRLGKVEMVMTNQKRLLYLTHYLELPDYKANIVFDYTGTIKFGLNIEEEILCSIINKSLGMIDTKGISDMWVRKTYDYRVKLIETQVPWFIGSLLLFMFVIALLVILFFRYRKEGIKLEALVQERTIKLNKYQEELESALKAAKAASKSKSVFLANMSHEIRTPMNSIMGFSELALDGETSQKTRDYLKNIKSNADWLLQIINDILDISKIESGKMELEVIPFDMHELFSSCRTLVMPKAVEKGILLHFYAEPSMGKMPVGDPTRLRQVLVNLLSNAVKFTNSGMIKLVSDIIHMDDKTISMNFEIRDSGIGMTPEQIQVIFDPFTQAETGTTRKYGGTGLGLTITKSIIEMMGGNLTVDSVPGIGSKFSFSLTFDTIDVPEEEAQLKQIDLNDIKKPSFDHEVLLCEDNEMNQMVIREHLKRVGIKTVIAENGKAGVDIIKNRINNGEKPFDLIFMDMYMPVMDGLEATAEIKKIITSTPIIAMTANVMTEDQEVYKAGGMDDYLGKPFTSQELWRCLIKYLEQK